MFSNTLRKALAATAALLALVACGGGLPPAQPAAPALTPASPARRVAHGGTAVTFVLPAIQPSGAPIDWKLSNLSSATRSIAGQIGGTRFGPVTLSASTPGCTAGTAGLQCSVTANAPAGTNEAFSFSTYATTGASGSPIAYSAGTVTVLSGQNNYTNVTPSGIVHALSVSVPQSTLPGGYVASVPITVYTVDAGNAPIPGPSHHLLNASLRKFGGLRLSYSGIKTRHTMYACCGSIDSFNYEGIGSGTETLTLTAPGYTASSTSITISPGSTALGGIIHPTMLGGITDLHPISFIEEFAQSASGNVAPIRTIRPAGCCYAFSYGEGSDGSFWIDTTHVSNSGQVLGTIAVPPATGSFSYARDPQGNVYTAPFHATYTTQCSINEYPSGQYGSVAAVRTIQSSSCYDDKSLAVDTSGDVFMSGYSSSGNSPQSYIVEYPPTGSGSAPPIRTIVVPGWVPQIDVDAAGNLYALEAGGLFEYAPGSTTASKVLDSTANVANFAVDDAGDVYAVVSAGYGGQTAIEVFRSGANTPSQTISGSNTFVASLYSNPILVPRS